MAQYDIHINSAPVAVAVNAAPIAISVGAAQGPMTVINAGTVNSVSVTTANGVSASVANSTTTPTLTFTLGAITPASVAAVGTVTGSNLSGDNSGDNAPNSLYSGLASTKADASALSALVPKTTTVNGQALSGNISLTASDVGASASGHGHAFNAISGTLTSAQIPTTLSGDRTFTDSVKLAGPVLLADGPDDSGDFQDYGSFTSGVDGLVIETPAYALTLDSAGIVESLVPLHAPEFKVGSGYHRIYQDGNDNVRFENNGFDTKGMSLDSDGSLFIDAGVFATDVYATSAEFAGQVTTGQVTTNSLQVGGEFGMSATIDGSGCAIVDISGAIQLSGNTGGITAQSIDLGTPLAVADGGTGGYDTATLGAFRTAMGLDNLLAEKAKSSEIFDFTRTTAPAGATGEAGVWTWSIPTGAKMMKIHTIGAGAGGGSGRVDVAGTPRTGGGGGGPGGTTIIDVPVGSLTTLDITVGAGGAGGASQTASVGNGVAGSAGGLTRVLSGGIRLCATGSSNFGAGGVGGSAIGGGGASSYCMWSSSGGTGTNTTGLEGGTTSGFPVSTGGSGGGGIAANNVFGIGFRGSINTVFGANNFASSQTTQGGNGTQNPIINPDAIFGYSGGGGGAGSSIGPAGAGANGTGYGAGGGGGGAALSGFSSGAGGAGADGFVRIIVTY